MLRSPSPPNLETSLTQYIIPFGSLQIKILSHHAHCLVDLTVNDKPWNLIIDMIWSNRSESLDQIAQNP